MRYWSLILAAFLSIFRAPCMAAETPLRLATLEYPPYIMNTDQGPQGLAVDIVRTAFSRIGRPIKTELFPVARGQIRLLSGDADAYFSIKKTPERERDMLFPQKTLMTQDYVFFVNKNSRWRFSGSFDSLDNAFIGVVIATSYGSRFDAAVKAGTFRKLETVASHESNFRKLLARRVDVVICSRLVGLYYLEMLNGLNSVEISGPTVETTSSYLVFTRKKDYTELSQQFDQALENMERDGTLKRLHNAYLPSPALMPPKPPKPPESG